MKFTMQAMDKDGNKQSETIEADTKKDALQKAGDQGLFPMAVDTTAEHEGQIPANQPTPSPQESQQFRQRFRVERVAFVVCAAILEGIYVRFHPEPPDPNKADLGPLAITFITGFLMTLCYIAAKALLGIGGFRETVPLNAVIPRFDWKRFIRDPLYFIGVFLALMLVFGLAKAFRWAFLEGHP